MDIDWIDRIPWQYRDYKCQLNGEVSNVLPYYRSFDLAINIQTAMGPPWGSIYTLSEKVISVLKEYIKSMLNQGKIQPSYSQQVHLSSLVQNIMENA
jgi:hypothetical protein